MSDRDTHPDLDPDGRRELLTILTAEHANLQAARSAGIIEGSGRTTAFLAALSGALVALALAAQVQSLVEVLAPIALLLAATVLYTGLVTFLRLAQLAELDSRLVIGINRIRHRYVELVPDVAAAEVLSSYDDRPGILGATGLTGRTGGRLDVIASAPAMVGGIDGVLAGVIAGLLGAQLGLSPVPSLVIGLAAGLATDAALLAYGLRSGARFWRSQRPRYPTPMANPPESAGGRDEA